MAAYEQEHHLTSSGWVSGNRCYVGEGEEPKKEVPSDRVETWTEHTEQGSSLGQKDTTWKLTWLAKHAIRQNSLPVFVILKDWTGRDYETWQSADSQSAKVDFLLYRLGLVPLRSLNLDEVSSDITRLLLVDGLNEVNARVLWRSISGLPRILVS